MKKNISLLLLSLMLVPGFALAQDTSGAQKPPAGSEVKNDLKDMQALDAKHVDGVKDLNAREKAAMQAVKDDQALTPAQRKEKLSAIRGDFRTQRKALNETFRADKKKIHGEMKADRAEVRKEAREGRKEAREAREERREQREQRQEGREKHEGGKNK